MGSCLPYMQPVAAISYPSLDDQPPAYEGATTVGPLIDLGSDITVPLPPQTSGGTDIISQLADMGITGGPTPASTQPTVPPLEQSSDEFDMFAKSRTAYTGNTGYAACCNVGFCECCISVSRGSTYEDLRVDQSQSLSQALQGHTTEPNTYSDLQEWLAPPTTASTSDPCAESATSAGMAIVTCPSLPILSASLLPPPSSYCK